MSEATSDSFLRDVQDEIMRRMLTVLLQEIRNRRGQQIPSDIAMKLCVSRMDKPLAKGAGGKDALRELAAKLIDGHIETGFLIQVEAAKKLMLKLSTLRVKHD